MRIRRYTGKNAQEAMQKVKVDLGRDAVILSTRKVRKKGLFNVFASPIVEVLAALDEDNARQQKQTTNKNYNQRNTQPKTVNNQMTYEQIKSTPNNVSNYSVYGKAISNNVETKIQKSTTRDTQNEENVLKDLLKIQPQENTNNKIKNLESKMHNMEEMIKKIYQNVSSSQDMQEKEISLSDTSEEENIQKQQSIFEKMYLSMIEYDVDEKLAEKIIKKIKENVNSKNIKEIYSVLNKILIGILGKPHTIKLREDGKPTIVMFLGPTGVGKTTTLAKIAADFSLNKQKKVGLITADTYRIAAVEQLKTYAEILDMSLSITYSPTEIQKAIKEHRDKDVILIDTAGRSYKNNSQFEELKMLVRETDADEVFLVLSTTISKVACRDTLKNYGFLSNFKLLFTKLDETPVYSIILNSRYLTGRTLSYLTAGQSVPDDFEVANIEKIVNNIIDNIRI